MAVAGYCLHASFTDGVFPARAIKDDTICRKCAWGKLHGCEVRVTSEKPHICTVDGIRTLIDNDAVTVK